MPPSQECTCLIRCDFVSISLCRTWGQHEFEVWTGLALSPTHCQPCIVLKRVYALLTLCFLFSLETVLADQVYEVRLTGACT
jgi:hypothetical protein